MPGKRFGKGFCLAAVLLAGACLALADTRPESKEPPLPPGALARLGTLSWRHGGPVAFVAFTPDGKGVITAGRDGTPGLYDRETGLEVRRFVRPQQDLTDAAQRELLAAQRALLQARLRGSAGAPNVALSPDGKLLAGMVQTDIVLWDAKTGKDLRTIRMPQTGIGVLVFSPDGKLLAGRGQQTTYLWETESGKEVRQLRGKPLDRGVAVTFTFDFNTPSLTFSADGKTLACCEVETAQEKSSIYVKLTDVETGTEALRIPLEQAGATAVTFAPQGKLLACATGNVIRLVDADTEEEVHQLTGHTGGIGQLTFSPNGKTLVSKGLADQVTILWDVESGKNIRRLGDAAPGRLDAARAARRLGTNRTRDLAFSPDSKVVAAGEGNLVRFWDATTGKELVARDEGHRGSIREVSVSPDRKVVITCGSDNTVRRWDAVTGKELSRFNPPNGIEATCISPDGRTIAVASSGDGLIRLFETATGKELWQLRKPTEDITQLLFSPDGKGLVVRGAFDPVARLCDTASGRLLREIALQMPGADPATGQRGFRLQGAGMAFSPDGKLLAVPGVSSPGVARAGGQDPVRPTVNLFDVATGQELRRVPLADGRRVSGLAFSPDGRTLAVESSDFPLTIWEVASGKDRVVLGNQTAPQPRTTTGSFGGGGATGTNRGTFAPLALSNLVFSPDGQKVALGTGGNVRVWDALTGTELTQLRGHLGLVTALSFSADSKVLASGSNDTLALLWDLGSLKGERSAPAKLTDKDLESLWSDLAGEDAVQAFKAIQALAGSPDLATAFVGKHLDPAASVDPKTLERLIADLAGGKLSVRKHAAEELEKLGDRAVPALKAARANDPPLDLRKRLDELLEKLTGGPLVGEQLRIVRAVEVLELAGTPDARALLQNLAKGAPGALPTREAQAALDRVNR
jgi:WD40 repeat protein